MIQNGCAARKRIKCLPAVANCVTELVIAAIVVPVRRAPANSPVTAGWPTCGTAGWPTCGSAGWLSTTTAWPTSRPACGAAGWRCPVTVGPTRIVVDTICASVVNVTLANVGALGHNSIASVEPSSGALRTIPIVALNPKAKEVYLFGKNGSSSEGRL